MLAVTTPAAQIAGATLTVSGSYTAGPPIAFDVSTDGGVTWAGVIATIGGGAFSFGLMLATPNASQTVGVRDRNAPTITASTGTFAVNAPPETIAVATPSAQTAGVAYTQTGTYTNAPPAAMDVSDDGGTTWAAAAATIGGGTYSFSHTIAAANALQVVRVRDSGAPTIIGTSGAFAVAGAAAATGAPDPFTDFVLAQTSPAHPAMTRGPCLGRFVPTGGIGPYSYTLNSATGTGNYRIGYFGADKLDIPYDSPAIDTSSDTITVTARDGRGVTITKTLPIIKSDATPRIFFSHVYGADNDNVSYGQLWQMMAFGAGHDYTTDAPTLSDPANKFFINSTFGQVGLVGYVTSVAAGSYPLHLTSTGSSAITADVTLTITPRKPIAYIEFTPRTVSTAASKGFAIGQALATTESGIPTWTLSGPDAALLRLKANTGVLTIFTTPLPQRTISITITCTDGAVSKASAFTFPVIVGTVLPASNMTFVVNSALTNYGGQTIGTPTVTGLSGTVTWAISYPEEYTPIQNASPELKLFVMDASTHQITCPGWLSARTYRLTIAATNGVDACVATYDVPVAWQTPTYPDLYVGPGSVSAHGSTIGFETMADVLQIYSASGSSQAAYAGSTVHVAWNADTNHYANDGQMGNVGEGLRTGIRGPAKFIGTRGPAGQRPRLGGTVGTPTVVGVWAVDQSKAAINLNWGDFVFDGFEMSDVHGSINAGGPLANDGGLSCIRKNGDTYGDLTILNCYIHDGDNGIEAGEGAYYVTIKNTEVANGGTAYVGSGATHNIYIGNCAGATVQDCKLWLATNGHDLKIRARKSEVSFNVIMDSERGSASNQIDFPSGGVHYVHDNYIQKGPNAEAGPAIKFCEEGGPNGTQDRINILTVTNNVFSLEVPNGNVFRPVCAVSHYGNYATNIDGSASVVIMDGNQIYKESEAIVIQNVSQYYLPTSADTNTTFLTSPPVASFANPDTGGSTSQRPGFPNYNWDNQSAPGTTYPYFTNVQIDPGLDDIRISRSIGVGQDAIGVSGVGGGVLITTMSATGNNLFKEISVSDARVNPFATVATWTLATDPTINGGQAWMPATAVTITTSGVQGLLKSGPGLAGLALGTYYIQPNVVNETGVRAMWRFRIVVTA